MRADARVLPVDTAAVSDDGAALRDHPQQQQQQQQEKKRNEVDAPDAASGTTRSTQQHQHQLVWIHARQRQLQRRAWTEKAVVLCDALQIYALVWQLAQPWPWPARWLRATRWVNALNLDAFSFRATGAALGATSQSFSLWGEMDNYWQYALTFAVLPPCGWLVARLADTHWRRCGRADYLVAAMRLELVLLQLAQRLYLPIGLAAMRLVNCNADNSVSVDPRHMGTCWSGAHALAVALITCGLSGSFLVGLPWLLHTRIGAYLTQPLNAEHERFVRCKELEFALGTSETFIELYMPLHTPFVRSAVTMPVEMCVLKLALLLVFALLRSPFPSRANQGLQGSLVVALIAAMAIRRAVRPSFRVRSTRRLMLLADSALVTNGVFVLLSANGVRSALTVSTALTSCLVSVNLAFAVLVALCLAQSVWVHVTRGDDGSLSAHCGWPVSSSPSEDDARAKAVPMRVLLDCVDVIHDTKATLVNTLYAAPALRSTSDLSTVLERLQACHEEAMRHRHLLEPLLRASVLVMRSNKDQVAELLLYVTEVYVDALATNPYRHDLPFPASELAHLSRALEKRAREQVLLSNQSRQVLNKVRTVTAWASTAAAAAATTQDLRAPQHQYRRIPDDLLERTEAMTD